MTDRRQFLKQLAAAGFGVAGLGALTDLQRIAAAAGPVAKAGADYKALVCIFMFGGNDSNNMVIPTSAGEWAQYNAARGAVRLQQAALQPLTLTNTPGRTFGLHPAMPQLAALVNAGNAAVVANVGPLLAPTSQAAYRNRSVPLPNNLFSHSDQQAQWQSSISDDATRTGWGGRIADIVKDTNGANQTSTCISVNGNNLFQTGQSISSYKVSSTAGFGIGMYKGDTATDPVSVAFREVMGRPYANAFEQTWANTVGRAVNNSVALQAALSGATINTVFPANNDLANQLKMVARLIAARNVLGMTRQVFFCSIGGFDTHGADQLTRQNELLGEISAASRAFWDATVEMGIPHQVTLFTASDFNRTFVSNGKGTDHAWGSHQFVMGGAVQGAKMYGTYPTIVAGGPDDTSDGRWIPTTSVDQYAATMANWFGVTPTDVATIFPKLSRFATPNLGFMG
ncbi:MAG: DUF1501 domain-containing protein [Betaproteobacteria bacterium]|nr:DUF1501 domain-containing protein [Betaproteobacteria bacterium]